ncbi:MAG: 16S rRNA (cytidine(1402)-2'-O)-methyltransferase [Ignavibacteria bacterium GWF2_33_9]|nr:MAG: 16S rRNA (cytidine(1402)-2'-O)-methyltransferase [Ignavibacteria bacterium GWF2_33_9]
MKPGLYLIPTPIGNLQDITLRSLFLLQSVDVLACEDTRTTKKLLDLYEISAPKLISYHNFNEAEKTPYIVSLIKDGNKVGLVSEAGTPLLSDPGFRIVQAIINEGLHMEALPGANAVLPALALSGFATHNFVFLGFPPQKKNRKTFLNNLKNHKETIVLYESPFRIQKLVKELGEIFPNTKRIALCREITKVYEETIRGTLEEVTKVFEERTLKGEFVIVIEGE